MGEKPRSGPDRFLHRLHDAHDADEVSPCRVPYDTRVGTVRIQNPSRTRSEGPILPYLALPQFEPFAARLATVCLPSEVPAFGLCRSTAGMVQRSACCAVPCRASCHDFERESLSSSMPNEIRSVRNSPFCKRARASHRNANCYIMHLSAMSHSAVALPNAGNSARKAGAGRPCLARQGRVLRGQAVQGRPYVPKSGRESVRRQSAVAGLSFSENGMPSVTDIPSLDPEVGQPLIYTVLGLSALSFCLTFFLAPKFKGSLKASSETSLSTINLAVYFCDAPMDEHNTLTRRHYLLVAMPAFRRRTIGRPSITC